jgi:hypothetical protein
MAVLRQVHAGAGRGAIKLTIIRITDGGRVALEGK